jgi:predicted membrane protein
MPDDRVATETPPRLTAHLGKFILWTTVVTAMILAIGGLSGVIRMEYTKATPAEHAIMLVLGGSCYGPLIGIALCLLVGVVRKLSWNLKRNGEK